MSGIVRVTDFIKHDTRGFRWWEETDGSRRAAALGAMVGAIKEQQESRLAAMTRYRRMYAGDRNAGSRSAVSAVGNGSYPRRVAINIIASTINTLTSKIAGNQVRPFYLTSAGDASQQRQAKMMERFSDGQFYKERFYRKAPICFRDGLIFGDGWLRVLPEDPVRKGEEASVAFRRSDPRGIFFDEVDALHGEPSMMYQVEAVNRDALIARYPNRKAAIEQCVAERVGNMRSVVDVVAVVRGWKLPASGKAGRYAYCVGKATLEEGEWTRKGFPFAGIKAEEPPDGIRGIGATERLEGYQIEANKVAHTIQISHHLMSVPRVWVEQGSNFAVATMNNMVGEILKYAGTKPIIEVASAVSPEYLAYLVDIVNRAYNEYGISFMSASSQKPPGLNAAVAMRTMVDIESDRFADLARRYEDFALDTAELAMQTARDIYDAGGTLTVKSPGPKTLSPLSFDAIAKIKPDDYVTQCYPTNFLPKSPEGRLQKVTELANSGLIPPEQARRLLHFPDVEAYYSLADSWMDETAAVIEKMLNGEPQLPDRVENIAESAKLVNGALLRAKADGTDEEVLGLLYNWLSEAEAMQAQAMQAQAMQAQAQAIPAMPPPAPQGPFLAAKGA